MNYLQNIINKSKLQEVLRSEEEKPRVNKIQLKGSQEKIVLMSDEHIGSKNYKKNLHLDFLQTVYDAGWFIIHLGDGIEHATRFSVGSGVYDQEEIVDRQVDEFVNVYQPFVERGKFLGMHVGNHEARNYKDTGFNLSRHISKLLGVKYFGVGKLHVIHSGNKAYTMYTTHGNSGALLPYTKIKSVLNLEKIVDADVYAMGHVHQLSHHIRNYFKYDGHGKKIEKVMKHFIICGGYLDYWGSYAQVQGYEPNRMGSPVVTFYENDKKIRVVLE